MNTRAILRLLVILCLLHHSSASADPIPIQDMKAAYLYNFALFSEWPRNKDNVQICAIKEASNEINLHAIAGKKVASKPIAISLVSNLKELAQCDVLYVNGYDDTLTRRLLKQSKQLSILTVGDSDNDAVMIRFLVEDNRLHFSIDLNEVNEANIELSSKLLRLAKRVQGDKNAF